MMATVTIRPDQVDRNYDAFKELLPELLTTHPGKFAVMHDGQVIDFFDSMGDAVRFGRASFGDAFSVQEVTSRNANLGYHSYAVHHVPN